MSNLNPEILAELKKGNREVLNGLHPLAAMQYGLAISDEEEQEQSPITDKGLSEAMLARLKDSGVKERLIKEIEEKEKATEENQWSFLLGRR
jgi:hypothetical protein